MRWLIGLILLPVLTVILAVVMFNAGVFHPWLQTQLSSRVGGEVHLGGAQILLRWPVTLNVGPTQVTTPAYNASVRQIVVRVSHVLPPYDVEVMVLEPRLSLSPPPAATPSAKSARAPAPHAGGTSFAIPIFLHLSVRKGLVRLAALDVKNIGLDLQQAPVMAGPMKLHLSATLIPRVLAVPLPLQVDAQNLVVTPSAVKSDGIHFQLAGIQGRLSGASLFSDQQQRWVADINVPDLARLPKPPTGVPLSGWKGAVKAHVVLSSTAKQPAWSITGKYQVQDLTAMLNYQAADRIVRGAVNLHAAGAFDYQNGVWNVPQMSTRLDLGSARLLYAGLFQKAEGVPFSLNFTGEGGINRIQIKNLTIRLANLNAQVIGQMSPVKPWPANFSVEVKPLSLKGWENLILPLKTAPVRGELALKGAFAGNLNAPQLARLTVSALKLSGLQAEIHYGGKNAKVQLNGPVLADLMGSGSMGGGHLGPVQASGKVRLGDMAVVAGPFQKTAGQAFDLNFAVKNSGETLQIRALRLNAPLGRVQVSGQILHPLKPDFDLAVRLAPLSLTALRKELPSLAHTVPNGSINGAVRVAGHLVAGAPWADWPIKVSGQVHVQIPAYKMTSAAADTKSAKAPPAQAAATPAGPLVPAGRLTSGLALNLSVDLGRLDKDSLRVSGIHVQGQMGGGHFRGAVKIQKLFSGTVLLSSLDVPLLTPKPLIRGRAQWKDLDIASVLEFAKPEFKSLASGRSTGTVDFATPQPGVSDFLTRLEARGQVAAEPFTLNTSQISGQINGVLRKIPGVKLSPVKMDSLHGKADASVTVQRGVAQVSELKALDQSGSELDLHGQMNLAAMQGDLSGTFFWVQNQIKGCLAEGNSDAKGRMMIPLKLTGNLMKPDVTIVTDMVGKLASKALECEKNKFLDQMKQKGQKKLEDELKKKLKGIFGN